ncbi:uncharacterized protein LOC122265656 isoform X1 [Penaeus japonicus]|uniref:uncharacterized protein LOC122265656 isoform X1 n=1 Tax=Penaeus japonicus TaxID=27405 RepID=UPI001C715110|nr:uncharacterized protein LOC122265656 isoform X1 [Penaeus japonicus]
MIRPKLIYKLCQKIVFVSSILIITWLYIKKERSLTAAHKRAKIPVGEWKYRSNHPQGQILQQQQQQQAVNYFALLQQQQQLQELQQQQQLQQQPHDRLPLYNLPGQVENQAPLQNDFRNQFAGQAPNQPLGIQNPFLLKDPGPVQPVRQVAQPANVFMQLNLGGMANMLAPAIAPEFEIVPSAKNVTPHDARLLVYNRVPKCGSTTVLDILNLTARMNRYWYRHSLLYNEMNLTSAQQRMVLTHLGVQNWKIPISYDRHMYYVDFAKQGNSRVAWMNIIRDPVERIISEFYFIRVKSRWDTIECVP